MKTTSTAILVALLALTFTVCAHNDTTTATTPEHWDEDYCEYIYQLETYIQFLEGEISAIDSDYIDDVLCETNEYQQYTDAVREFYNIPAR